MSQLTGVGDQTGLTPCAEAGDHAGFRRCMDVNPHPGSFGGGIGPQMVFATPELDPSAGMGAVLFLIGMLAVIRGRKR